MPPRDDVVVQMQRGRAGKVGHYLFGAVEVVLVMADVSRVSGDGRHRAPAPPRPARALLIVGDGGRDVAKAYA